MKTNDDEIGCGGVMLLVVTVLLLATTVATVAIDAGVRRGAHATKTEAVEKGAAEWVPKSDGTVEFRWKVKP